ncbi:hypothetical protein DYB32_004537 [Aphanomyces invadans]|uniref:LAA1-like C-terminal TPR repeats domain-containing protein n=1 Tax=Aphanomyces invadans TaxID=157072 RepID=A0A418AXB0_9STRA|nr:hypothetical protein DYB32_004537 [Aphanomyces invadans]
MGSTDVHGAGATKEQVNAVSAAIHESADLSFSDVTAHRKLLRSLCSLKMMLSTATPSHKKDLAAGLVRPLVLAIQVYHAKQQNGSDSIVQLFCDVLLLAYDGSAVSEVMEVLLNKSATLGSKLTIARAMSHWTYAQVQSAAGFVPELISLGNKHAKHADLYVRHSVVDSLSRALSTYGCHGHSFHSDALKLAAKLTTDKYPEIRQAAAILVRAILEHTDAADAAGLDALFSVLSKTLDDPAPELRRTFATLMGQLLGLYVVPLNDAASPSAPSTTSVLKKKASPSPFPSVDLAIQFVKDSFCTLPASGNGIGGTFATAGVILATLFHAQTHLTEPHFHATIAALLSYLDMPLPSANEYVRIRSTIGFAFRAAAKSLNEREQHQWLRAVVEHFDTPSLSHHQRLVLAVECSHLFHALGEASVVYAAPAAIALTALLSHEKHSLRVEAAGALASLAVAVPYRRQAIFDLVLRRLTKLVDAALPVPAPATPVATDTTDLYSIQGLTAALTHLLRATKLQGSNGFSLPLYNSVLELADRLVQSQFRRDVADPIWLTCTRAGWELLGAVLPMHLPFTTSLTTRLCRLWSSVTTPQVRDQSQELLRVEGALVTLHVYLMALPPDPHGLAPFFVQLLHATLTSVLNIGVPSKQRAKVAKHRVMAWLVKCYILLPPTLVADSWITLLDLIAEFTTAQSLTSLQRSTLVPPATTALPLSDVATAVRLVAGDLPDPMYHEDLNFTLALLLADTAMSDIELETAYLDHFVAKDTSQTQSTSAFTYVRMVDASVQLFPLLFLVIPHELQLRVLQHFAGVLADPKVPLDVVVNVSALMLATVREAQTQSRRCMKPNVYHAATWPGMVQSMLLELLGSSVDAVRLAAAEALGLVASLMSESNIRLLVADLEANIATHQHDNKSTLLAGSALALAHLKRSCGSRCAVDVTLLYRLSQEHMFSMAQPLRTSSLRAWSLLLECVNTSGDYEDQYVAPSLHLMELQLVVGFRIVHGTSNKKGPILRASTSVCVINSIVSALGPELLNAGGSRIDLLYAFWDLLRMTADPRIELEYLRFIEQLVLFAPSYFKASDLTRLKGLLRQPMSTSAECRAVMLLIVRILVERDPSLIHEEHLHLMLFQALEVHEIATDYPLLPRFRGMFPTGHRRHVPSNPIAELQGCLTALLVTDCGVQRLHNGNKACEWLLLCRGLAVGGVVSVPAPSVDDLSSPRGADSPVHHNSSTAPVSDIWRRTNHRVCATLADIPCLHRRVREFAVLSVVAVLELVAQSTVASVHFDVGKTRAAVASLSEHADSANFVSLYVDEVMTLACQISALSMDGFELQHIQSVGMALLNVVCHLMASCVDPEVPDETLFVQYQAQLSSTIRRAFASDAPSTSCPFDPATLTAYEPLQLEGAVAIAHVMANKIITDKVGAQRLVKLVLRPDFTYDASSCDDTVRFRLSIATLGSLARVAVTTDDMVTLPPHVATAWMDALRDFCLLHAGPPHGAIDYAGKYFKSTRDLDVLKGVAMTYAPVLVAALAKRPAESALDRTTVLTIALLYFSVKTTDVSGVLTVLEALPTLIVWNTMTPDTYDNVVHTLFVLASHPDDTVQVAALRGIQTLSTKDGAAYVQAAVASMNSLARQTTLQQIHLATTVVLRSASARKLKLTDASLSALVLESLRTAAAGTAVLLPLDASFGPAYVVVANNFLRHCGLECDWLHPTTVLYVDATLRCVVMTSLAGAASEMTPALATSLRELLDTIEWLAVSAVDGAHNLVVPFAAKLVSSATIHLGPHVDLFEFHDRIATAWMRHVTGDDASIATILSCARSVAGIPVFSHRIGNAVVRLLHGDVRTLSSDIVNEIEAWISVLMTAMEVAGVGETCLQIVLPLLLRLPQPTTTGRILIGIATTNSTSFKAAVGHLSEDTRGALQTVLRQALAEKTETANAPSSSMSLDFSRYG